MPTTTDYKEFLDSEACIFATPVVRRVTVWTLQELLNLAGVPKDAEMSQHRIAPENHWDSERDLEISDINFYKTEYFNKEGEKVRLVPVEVAKSETREYKQTVGYKLEVIK